jgi:hypothetical protein
MDGDSRLFELAHGEVKGGVGDVMEVGLRGLRRNLFDRDIP